MKKILALVLSCGLFIVALTGCGSFKGNSNQEDAKNENQPIINSNSGSSNQVSTGQNLGGDQQNGIGQSQKGSAEEEGANKSQQPDNTNIKVVYYVPDEQGNEFHKKEKNVNLAENQNTSAELLTVKQQVELVMQEIIRESGSRKAPFIPAGTKVLGVTVGENKNSIIVNLSEEFETGNPGGSTGIRMAIGPLVLSLTELDGIKEVYLRIEGESGDFKGHYDLTVPFERSEFEQSIAK